jgi:hypothetical protein
MERVDICNMALSFLGENPITSIDDDSNNAQQLKIQYVPARDATLEAHDWTFAIKRFIPASNAVPPVYGATYAFDVPSDILRVLSVDRQDSYSTVFTPRIDSEEQIDWQFEERQVICDLEIIYCRGLRRIEDEGLFSPLFVQAFAAKLAVYLALNLTSATDIRESMRIQYDEAISEAKARDGLQGRSKRIRNRSFAKAR